MPQRQEVVNVVLAQVLGDRGLVALPEQILTSARGTVQLPDVLIDFRGLRMAIEAEFASSPNSATRAYSKAAQRVEDGIAHIGVAIVYPTRLRHTGFGRLKESLEQSTLKFAVVTEIQSPETQLHLFDEGAFTPQYLTGKVDDLVDVLTRSYDQLVQDDTLERAVQVMHVAMEFVVESMRSQPASTDRVAMALGIRDVPADAEPASGPRFTPRQRVAVNRISALIVVNALVFQEVLARTDDRVQALQRFRTDTPVLSVLRDHWNFILTQINYWPIFSTAHGILSCLTADRQLEAAIRHLIDAALRIVACRAALRHDLAGRIYHRLLEESKYLGAYYTSVASATMLLKLALRPTRYAVDWGDIDALRELRIADLACGTGTLLMAAADAMTDNYVRRSVEQHSQPDYDALQRASVEDILYGYDVLPSAVHLTASTLTLRAPDTPINATHLYRMPIGGPERALGSLEFIDVSATPGTLFGLPEQVTGAKPTETGSVRIPRLDLCVMNPPFTRSVGGNLLFGHLPEAERQPMRRRLQRLVRARRLPANLTAGLGAVFVALADEHIHDAGSLALVLPRAVLGGVAWRPTRTLIAGSYRLETVVTSHEPGHWNFSENTSLSETLLVARKCRTVAADARTVFVNLWRQPRNAIEALSIARAVSDESQPELESESAARDIMVGGDKYGESFSVSWTALRNGRWGYPAAFAQTELNRVVSALRESRLRVPGANRTVDLPVCALGDIAQLGFDRRDIHDGFDVQRATTPHAALWGHDATRNTAIALRANRFLRALEQARPGRSHRDAAHLWRMASRLVIVERLRLNTMCVVAGRTNRLVLSNVWWTVLLAEGVRGSSREKALALWLNSTIGIATLIGYREETEGAWVDFKKPVLGELPVLNLRTIGRQALEELATAYDAVARRELSPIAELHRDAVRAAIDTAISRALRLPNLSSLRTLLAQEPILRQSTASLLPETGDN